MWLQQIDIKNIRSLKSFNVDFSKKLNIILGPNGSGKTSILESIHLLSLGKSFRPGKETNLINSSSDYYRVKGIVLDNEDKFSIQTSRNVSEKRINLNNTTLKSRSSLIGVFPTVVFSPETLDIISGGKITRLAFFNRVFCTVDPEYTDNLVQLEKILLQKKQLLKNKQTNQIDYWNQLLAEKSHKIWKKRHKLWTEFSEEFEGTWNLIFPEKNASIGYSYFKEISINKIIEKLDKAKEQEILYGRALFGPQKDEFVFHYNNNLLKEFGSQGEKKFFHYILKLVEGEFIKKKSGKTPVLLLDDLFAKIDSDRIEKMLNSMFDKFQMFITSTDIHKDGIKSWISTDTKLINI
jgi:DNA replication and repair protein RecF